VEEPRRSFSDGVYGAELERRIDEAATVDGARHHPTSAARFLARDENPKGVPFREGRAPALASVELGEDPPDFPRENRAKPRIVGLVEEDRASGDEGLRRAEVAVGALDPGVGRVESGRGLRLTEGRSHRREAQDAENQRLASTPFPNTRSHEL